MTMLTSPLSCSLRMPGISLTIMNNIQILLLVMYYLGHLAQHSLQILGQLRDRVVAGDEEVTRAPRTYIRRAGAGAGVGVGVHKCRRARVQVQYLDLSLSTLQPHSPVLTFLYSSSTRLAVSHCSMASSK